jgi:hypothetical protein
VGGKRRVAGGARGDRVLALLDLLPRSVEAFPGPVVATPWAEDSRSRVEDKLSAVDIADEEKIDLPALLEPSRVVDFDRDD